MKNIFKFLFVFVLLFSFLLTSTNATTGNLPRPVNSAASSVASPTEVRDALNKKYPYLKYRYCSDYRKSGDGVTARCRGSYHLTKVDLAKVTNPDSSWGPYLPVNLNHLKYTPTQVRDCIKKKYNFDVTYKYSDYRRSGDGIALWTSGKPCLKLSAKELTNCNTTTVTKCGIDLYKVGTSCVAVGIGYYSPADDDTRYTCTNAPANAKYTSDGNGTNNCSWTCNTDYHLEDNTCVADTKTCTIDNGTGEQTWDGNSWSECEVVSCNTNYHLENNTCVANTKSCTIDNGTGEQTWDGNSWSECEVISCNSGYEEENNSCVEIQTNTPPTITKIELDSFDFEQLGEYYYRVNENSNYTITISGNDVDGDNIIYYIDGEAISGNSKTFPKTDGIPKTHIIKAYDGKDFSNEITLKIVSG